MTCKRGCVKNKHVLDWTDCADILEFMREDMKSNVIKTVVYFAEASSRIGAKYTS